MHWQKLCESDHSIIFVVRLESLFCQGQPSCLAPTYPTVKSNRYLFSKMLILTTLYRKRKIQWSNALIWEATVCDIHNIATGSNKDAEPSWEFCSTYLHIYV